MQKDVYFLLCVKPAFEALVSGTGVGIWGDLDA